jgi:hypothetical protein
LLGAPFGGCGERAGAGEAPDDDQAGDSFDRRVESEADERNRAGDDAGGDRDGAFDAER